MGGGGGGAGRMRRGADGGREGGRADGRRRQGASLDRQAGARAAPDRLQEAPSPELAAQERSSSGPDGGQDRTDRRLRERPEQYDGTQKSRWLLAQRPRFRGQAA